MKAIIDMENLGAMIEQNLNDHLEVIINKQVENCVESKVEELAKNIIAEKVAENFQKFVDEYISKTKIRIGGNSYWDDEEVKELTVEQYIKYELKNRLESKKLRVKSNNRYSDYEEVSFEDYIKSQFNANDIIKADLDSFLDEVRKKINQTVKNTFDKSTKDMLSNTVLSILTANDTYRKIENNIKCIANKGNKNE